MRQKGTEVEKQKSRIDQRGLSKREVKGRDGNCGLTSHLHAMFLFCLANEPVDSNQQSELT